MISIGDVNTKVYIGDTEAKVYIGDELIYPTGQHDYSQDYLTFKITASGNINWGVNETIEYSKDGGTTWSSITATSVIPVNTDDVLLFRGNNNTYVAAFKDSSAQFSVEGNIMSLIYGDDFINKTTLNASSAFTQMFQGCRELTTAENLILPATALTAGCYRYMFQTCTKLTKTPELPATILANYCYESMFNNCFLLTDAPVLPATTLTNYCYQYMFQSCSNLNYIKCLATNISATRCVRSWVLSISSTGTFVKKVGVSWPTGADGIPSGWTVEEE